jgi:hypothetical protein
MQKRGVGLRADAPHKLHQYGHSRLGHGAQRREVLVQNHFPSIVPIGPHRPDMVGDIGADCRFASDRRRDDVQKSGFRLIDRLIQGIQLLLGLFVFIRHLI